MDSSKHRLPYRIVTDCLALTARSEAGAGRLAGRCGMRMERFQEKWGPVIRFGSATILQEVAP